MVLFLPSRTVLAPAGAVGVLRTPVVNHGHNVTKWAPTVLALVWAAFTPIVRDMFPTTWTVRMLWTPTIQQRTQRGVLRSAIDAEILAALSALVQSVFTLAGSAWMLRAPAIQQRPRIAGRRSTVLAVFAHASCTFLCFKMPVLDYKIYYPLATCFYLRLSPMPSTENVVNLFL